MPDMTGLVYRVSYRRSSWKPGTWKNKLFNTEASARKYADNLVKPIDEDTPEKFAKLAPATVRIAYASARWNPLPDEDGVIETLQPDGPPTPPGRYSSGVRKVFELPEDER